MSWVNLNDVYVNQTGGTIAGDLSVNGALTVNDGKGTNTTYNVANEITTLRDSVSQDTGWIKLYTGYNGRIKYRATLNTCCLMVCGIYGFTTGYAVPNELPNKYLPTCEALYCPLYMRQSNNTAGIWIPQRDSSDRKFYLYSAIQTDISTAISGFVYWTI